MSFKTVSECYRKYILPTYPASDLLLVQGGGSYVYDSDGKKYIDFTCGIGVCNIGHCNKKVTEAITAQVSKLVHVSNLFMNIPQGELAEKLVSISFKGRVFFANSGAEANEGMIKFARKWGNKRNRNIIITMKDSFHGRTLATLAATGRKKYREGFEPETEGFVQVDYNDFSQIEKVYKEKVNKISAILMEPIQGEGGIIPAYEEYMKKVRGFCNEKEILLMFDEVQTGIGRTGKYFGYQNYGVEPDLLSLAKGLGNGFPIGAFIVNDKIENVLIPGTHASTFGGTPLACSAGLAVLNTIKNEDMLENAMKCSELIFNRFEEMCKKYDCMQSVRGKGLMVGIVLNIPTSEVLKKAKKKGLLLIPAGENVIRFYPQLNVSEDVLVEGLNIFENVISSFN